MGQRVKDTILQEFSRSPGGQLCLHFSDPEYVRSEFIILDSSDSSLYAVLHGAPHFVGHASKDLAGSLKHNDEIILNAPHYFSGTVNLTAKVSVT